MAKRKGNKLLRVLKEILSIGIYLVVVLLLTWFVITFVAQKAVVKGHSMEYTLHDQDQLLADKISYRFHEPKRYDIIVFPYQHTSVYYIKRIIGMPGETIQIDQEGKIYINGQILNESYGKEVMQSPGIAENAITLADDEYFVLGDNRNDSQDSRDISVGPVKKKDIIGKAFIRIWPFDKIGVLKHQ